MPKQLRLGDSVISVTMETDVAVFPTSEYVLVEISSKAGKIDVRKIASTIRNLVRNDKRIVAIRGYGFKGVGLAVRIAHELKLMEQRFTYEMTFDTFDATDSDNKPITSIQIVIVPPA